MTKPETAAHDAVLLPCPLVTLEDCPPGLFQTENGLFGFKSEYRRENGAIEAFCDTGEFFWGSYPHTAKNQRAQLVRPVATPPARPGALDARAVEAKEVAQMAEASRASLSSALGQIMLDWKLLNTRDEDGAGFPLVDALTPDGESIAIGQEEISELAAELADFAIRTLAQHKDAAPVEQGKGKVGADALHIVRRALAAMRDIGPGANMADLRTLAVKASAALSHTLADDPYAFQSSSGRADEYTQDKALMDASALPVSDCCEIVGRLHRNGFVIARAPVGDMNIRRVIAEFFDPSPDEGTGAYIQTDDLLAHLSLHGVQFAVTAAPPAQGDALPVSINPKSELPGEAWIIWFNEAGVPPEVFSGEGAEQAALRRYEACLTGYNCHLFRKVLAAQGDAEPVAWLATYASGRVAFFNDLAAVAYEEMAHGARSVDLYTTPRPATAEDKPFWFWRTDTSLDDLFSSEHTTRDAAIREALAEMDADATTIDLALARFADPLPGEDEDAGNLDHLYNETLTIAQARQQVGDDAQDAVIEQARNVYTTLAGGFVVCSSCGDQETTSDIDWVQELGTALRNFDAAIARQAGGGVG